MGQSLLVTIHTVNASRYFRRGTAKLPCDVIGGRLAVVLSLNSHRDFATMPTRSPEGERREQSSAAAAATAPKIAIGRW